MSGVVFLPPPPKPKQRHLRTAVAWLGSLLHREPRQGAGSATGQPSGGLRVRSRRSRGRRIVELAGTLNGSTRAPLVEVLEDALEDDAGQVVLDLDDLESIDPAGLDAVLTAHLRASDQFKVLLIVPGPQPVQRVFDNAQVPFLYTARQGGRVVGRARSHGRRAGLSARPARPEGRAHIGRRSP